MAAEGSLIVIVVGLDANKGEQQMVFEHLAHFRDALPMSRFPNTMDESEQAEDLPNHLVVWNQRPSVILSYVSFYLLEMNK